jgi:hypothetical protein
VRKFGTAQSTLGVSECGCEIFASATCPLKFSKASAATLLQQRKNNSPDVRRGSVKISGFIGAVAS